MQTGYTTCKIVGKLQKYDNIYLFTGTKEVLSSSAFVSQQDCAKAT